MRIRGTFLKDYIEIVRNNPELDWDRYLVEDDWAIVRSMVIPAQWYPVETMARVGRGIFDMRSNNNYEVVRMHGRARALESFDEATRKFLLKDDPAASIRAYAAIAGRYVDGLAVKVEEAVAGRARVSFFPVDDAPAWDLFREVQAGSLEKFVELNGGKNIRSRFIERERDGREECLIELEWDE